VKKSLIKSGSFFNHGTGVFLAEEVGVLMNLFHSGKKKKKVGGRVVGFAVVTCLAFIVILISCLHKPYQNVHFFGTEDDLQSITDGWTAYADGETYSISLPTKDEIEYEGESITLVNVLPDSLPVNPAILMRTSLQEIEVYVDGTLTYSYGGDEYHAFGRNNGSIWNIVPLSDDAGGKEVKVVIRSPYDYYRSIINTFYVGTYSSALSFLFNSYFTNLILIFVTFMVGIGLFIFYMCLKISGIQVANTMLHISLMGIFTSLWEFTECKITQVLVGNMAGFSACNFLLLMLLPIPIAMYIDDVEKKHYHHIAVPVEILFEINVLVQIVLQVFGVKDFYDMMLVTHGLIILNSAVMLATLIRKYVKYKEPGLLLLLASISFLCVGGAIEIFVAYNTGYVGGTILIVAVMVVIIVTGLQSVRGAFNTIQDSRRAIEENAAKSTFLANMSHEIRTPMNAICAMSELLMNAEDMTAGNRDFAKTINSSAANLLDIINDLLDFSKISANKYDIIDEEYELQELVDDVREVIAVRAHSKGLKFNINVNPNIPFELEGDLGRVRQILLNLLNNAVKYTKEGEVTLKVDFETLEENKIKLIMTVSDTGVGIMPEDMDELFEAFVQVDKLKNHANEGTGLGLAISRALAVMMGGGISVKSEYGVGSTFTATVVQTMRSKKTFKQEISAYYESTKNGPIILVESGFEITGYYKKLLGECGAEYITCKEEEISEEIFMKEKPVVLFTTREHPYLLSQEFKGEHPFVRAVGVAGSMETVTTHSICEIVRKPFTVADLMHIIEPKEKENATISFEAPEAKVMVVDDNVVNLRVMKELLHKYRITPTVCSNGTQAVAAMKAKKFDLIFMDHMMPGMDGIETTQLIREIPECGKKVKIVALTANAIKGIEKVFKENGFDAFLAKPVSLHDLGKVLLKQLPEKLIKKIND